MTSVPKTETQTKKKKTSTKRQTINSKRENMKNIARLDVPTVAMTDSSILAAEKTDGLSFDMIHEGDEGDEGNEGDKASLSRNNSMHQGDLSF